ncbi:MAG TPA: isoprenylcysteine carboxylmethyltransferase family protein [Terriglobales bacterium]|nr:isoprenylcysteine carboxylmethyltransferase family protein [Terriglobales bacterium]
MSEMSIVGYLWSAFFVVWLVWAIGTKKTQTRESLRSRIPYVVLNIAAFYAMFSRAVAYGWMRLRILPPDPWIENLGVAITAAGLLFAVWARAYLGRNWSGTVTIKVGHQLVRSGPYRWVRHPIYSGMILAMLGTAITRGQLRGLVAVVLLWIGFTMKLRIEERFMTTTFGPEYEEYSRTTGAILPRLL